MNGYYSLVIKLLQQIGYEYYRNGKGSHEIWVQKDKDGNICGRCQIPRHLDNKVWANKLLKDARIKEKIR